MLRTFLLSGMILNSISGLNVALASEQSALVANNSPQKTATLDETEENVQSLQQELAFERAKFNSMVKNLALLKDTYSSTTLHHAAGKGMVDIVQMLIAGGAPVDAPDNDGDTPLMNAARAGHAVVVDMLIKEGAKVDLQNKKGWTALMMVAGTLSIKSVSNSLKVMDILIAAKADLNSQHHELKFNSLMRAMSNINPEFGYAATMRLIDAGADLNQQDSQRKSPLFYAASYANNPMSLNILKKLVELNVDLNQQDENGWSALMSAVANRNTEAVQVLLDADADINLKTTKGETAYDIYSRFSKFNSKTLPKELRSRFKPKGFFSKLFGDQ